MIARIVRATSRPAKQAGLDLRLRPACARVKTYGRNALQGEWGIVRSKTTSGALLDSQVVFARPHATSAVAAFIGILPAISWNQWPLCVEMRISLGEPRKRHGQEQRTWCAAAGVAQMPSTNTIPSVTVDQLMRALGETVIRIWSNSPQEVRIISSRRRWRLKAKQRRLGHVTSSSAQTLL